MPGNLAGALAVEQAGDRATQVEVGYFLTRSGFGDELRYRSTLRDVYTLTTGGTRATLVGASAENALAYRPMRPGAPAQLHEERAGARGRTFEFAGVKRADPTLAPGAHGPVAAWGLDALLHGAASAGLEDVTSRAQPT